MPLLPLLLLLPVLLLLLLLLLAGEGPLFSYDAVIIVCRSFKKRRCEGFQ